MLRKCPLPCLQREDASFALVLHTASPPYSASSSVGVWGRCLPRLGAVHERGESCPCFLPRSGSLFSSIRMFCPEVLQEMNRLASAWTLQRETQEDSFPGFLLPHPGHLLRHAIVLWLEKYLIRKSYVGNVFTQEDALILTYNALFLHISHLIPMIIL